MAKRLIDAKAFDLRLSQKKMTELFPNWKYMTREIRDAVCAYAQYFHMLLETQPTVDAVEVVRCRECAWYDESGRCTNSHCTKSYYGCRVPKQHYCSYGERRTDGTA